MAGKAPARGSTPLPAAPASTMNQKTYLCKRLGCPAKEEEIADELNVSVDRYRGMLKETSPLLIPLDTPLSPMQ